MPPAEGQRQVLVRQPLQVRVVLPARQLEQTAVQQCFVERVQERRLPLGHFAVGLADERLEVGAGNHVPAVGNSAAHHVEQRVREMPVRAEIVAGKFQTVGGRHDANQAASAAPDILVKLHAQVAASLEEPNNGGDARGVLIHLRNDAPLFACAGCKRQVRIDEIGAAAAANQSFLVHRLPAPEAVELRRAQQPACRFDALRPDRRHPQRLIGLGPVGWNRAELEEAQPRFEIEFVLLVAVRQRAVFHLEAARQAVRQKVLDAVQQIDLHRFFAQVDQSRAPHEAETVARHPGAGKRQRKRVIHLFEYDLVAVDALRQAARDAVQTLVPLRERLPHRGAPGAGDQ